VANAKRAEKRHRKQAKAEVEEQACQEHEEAARWAHKEAERKACKEFAKLQAECQWILEEKACLMAEDKWKAEAERQAEVAAGKQKAGEPVKKRVREELVTGASGIQTVDLQ